MITGEEVPASGHSGSERIGPSIRLDPAVIGDVAGDDDRVDWWQRIDD
jgi:hypothetical protein